MSERKFEELSIEEQRNEILKAIHNRLSEISITLEYFARETMSDYSVRNMNEFQREWTKYIERCKGLYIDENRKETQKGEPN